MKDLYLPQARYIAVLERQRERIATSTPLVAWDDDSIGSRGTHCSWGLCSNDRESWPDAEDHLWPDQFTKDGRVAPKYRADGQFCPFDIPAPPSSPMHGKASGCFSRCRIFRHGERMTQKRALKLYDEQLAKAKEGAP